MISSIVGMLVWLYGLVILIHVVLSYFLSPYHPIRETLGKLVEPLLSPIRRFIPSVGNMDFSPLILLVIIQLAGQLLVRLLVSLGL